MGFFLHVCTRLDGSMSFPGGKAFPDLFICLAFGINYTISISVSARDDCSSLVATSGIYNAYKMAIIMLHISIYVVHFCILHCHVLSCVTRSVSQRIRE